MDETPLRYDLWVEQALRGVIRRALDQVVEQGLPGDHHFYLTFKTETPGVVLADSLRQKYPDEMTIILQNQFWNLSTDHEAVEVTLAFNGVRQPMRVPFHAVTAFADPAVNFGLQLKILEADGAAPTLPPATPLLPATGGATPSPVPPRASRKRKPAEVAKSTDEDSAEDDTTGEVIALDAFRKK